MERDDIESSLSKKGFKCIKADHRYYHHEYNGKETGVTTKVSMGTKYKRLGNELLSLMKKQLRLDTSQEFRDFVTCPMSKEQYATILIQKGIIKAKPDTIKQTDKDSKKSEKKK